ncbi:hypothetical protein GBF38_002521 [Nibea albiflora]|uniref:Uncharacterized protein n=1 Tax=Nibea albiflora TaxID=240163 RepID=A0ACB7EEH8_NIBAL|nr:hypothetical protein GBF38_002521 [Nibea albiflora]
MKYELDKASSTLENCGVNVDFGHFLSTSLKEDAAMDEKSTDSLENGAYNCVHAMSTGGQYNPSGEPLVGQQGLPLDVLEFSVGL